MDHSTAQRPRTAQAVDGETSSVSDGDTCSYPRRIARGAALLVILLGLIVTPIWMAILAWLVLKGVVWLLQ